MKSLFVMTCLTLASLLFGCNGGICSDDDCNCPSGDTCDFECPQGNCSQQCAADSDCEASCEGGSCSQQCSPNAVCDFTCAGGNCTQQCAGSDRCDASCSGDNCTTDEALNNLNLGL